MRKSLFLLTSFCVLAALSVRPASAQRLPPRDYEDRGACPFECCTYREWSVKADTTLYKSRAKNAPAVFRVKKGERVTGLTGVVVTLVPGKAVARKPTTIGDGARKVLLKVGDVLYLLHYEGEAVYKIWFRGRIYEETIMSAPVVVYADPEERAREPIQMLSEPRTVWWVKVRNRRGQVGWSRQPEHFDDMDACG
jgi:hypothetical protein